MKGWKVLPLEFMKLKGNFKYLKGIIIPLKIDLKRYSVQIVKKNWMEATPVVLIVDIK